MAPAQVHGVVSTEPAATGRGPMQDFVSSSCVTNIVEHELNSRSTCGIPFRAEISVDVVL